jgi:hypothetical protein
MRKYRFARVKRDGFQLHTSAPGGFAGHTIIEPLRPTPPARCQTWRDGSRAVMLHRRGGEWLAVGGGDAAAWRKGVYIRARSVLACASVYETLRRSVGGVRLIDWLLMTVLLQLADNPLRTLAQAPPLPAPLVRWRRRCIRRRRRRRWWRLPLWTANDDYGGWKAMIIIDTNPQRATLWDQRVYRPACRTFVRSIHPRPSHAQQSPTSRSWFRENG